MTDPSSSRKPFSFGKLALALLVIPVAYELFRRDLHKTMVRAVTDALDAEDDFIPDNLFAPRGSFAVPEDLTASTLSREDFLATLRRIKDS